MKKSIVLLFAILVAGLSYGRQKEQADSTKTKIDSTASTAAVTSAKKDSMPTAKDTVAVKKAAPAAVDTSRKQAAATTPPAERVWSKNQVDSLVAANDSLSKSLHKYLILYTAIKEKVIKHDFDPTKMSMMIDSLASKRDSSFSRLNTSSVSLRDSITVLRKEIVRLNEKISSLTSRETGVDKLIRELKMLKELLDASILTQSEFDIKKAAVLQKWE